MKRELITMAITCVLVFLLGLLIHVFYRDFTMFHVAATAIGSFIAGVIFSLIDGDM